MKEYIQIKDYINLFTFILINNFINRSASSLIKKVKIKLKKQLFNIV